jgi:hypothetical protein
MLPAPGPVDARSERFWRLAVMAVAAALFLSTTSSNVQFGDSAEGVAGVASLGILHAPGYVAWVAAARLFSELVPFGDLAFRVALFSVVCATATVGLVFAIARRLGASQPGAAVGALSLAVSSSFWFYAGYAKAYAFTSLLIAVTLWCLLAWKADGSRWQLIVAGAAMGISLGAAWQSMAVAVPGIALLLFASDRRPRRAEVAALCASGVAAAGAVVAWVFVRAGADPAITWGGASTPNRAFRLLLMRDFVNLQGTGAGTARGNSVASGDNLVALIAKLLRVPLLVTADLGIALLVLVLIGLVVAVRSRAATRWWPLATIYIANVGAVLAVIAPGRRPRSASISREQLLRTGGFTLAAAIALACITALGATWAMARVGELLHPTAPKRRPSGRASDQRRARQAAATAPRPGVPWPGFIVAALVLAGTAALHWPDASHHQPDLAGDYAHNVLTSLPEDAVLLTNLLERSFTLEYEQVVEDLRPDVDLVQIEKLPASWYSETITERLGIELESSYPNAFEAGLAVADQLQGERPVYYDASALSSLVQAREDLGYRAIGLVAEALPAGEGQSFDHEEVERLLEGYRLDGLFDDPARTRFPNGRMLAPYVATYADLGAAYAREERFDEAHAQLDLALKIDPDNETATQILREVEALEAKTATGG